MFYYVHSDGESTEPPLHSFQTDMAPWKACHPDPRFNLVGRENVHTHSYIQDLITANGEGRSFVLPGAGAGPAQEMIFCVLGK